MWVKFRHKFSDGDYKKSPWEWDYLFNMDLESAKKYVEEDLVPVLKEQYELSEHYRGVEWVLELYPPKEILLHYIALAKLHIKNFETRIDSFEK
jgi:hypothetical protein